MTFRYLNDARKNIAILSNGSYLFIGFSNTVLLFALTYILEHEYMYEYM